MEVKLHEYEDEADANFVKLKKKKKFIFDDEI